MTSTTSLELNTLARARRGDQRAWTRLMEPYRRELVAYCYRLTGTLSEAEDLVQEAFVRAFRALESFEGRATPRAWLYRIAHNLCLNHVQRRPPHWESLDTLDESQISDAGPTAEGAGQGREDLRLGFVALVQSLPPRQRAALVLRDVLGWSAEETARLLETTVPAVKNALARARRTLADHPSGGDPDEVRDLAARDTAARSMVAEWVDAFEKGNTARMVELLTGEDVESISSMKQDRSGYTLSDKIPVKNKQIPAVDRRQTRENRPRFQSLEREEDGMPSDKERNQNRRRDEAGAQRRQWAWG